jgi:hypothetical protein
VVDTHMPFRFFCAYQDLLWVGNKSTVDKRQADVVWEDGDLAYARADRSTAFLVIITETPAMLNLSGGRSDAGDDVTDLEYDVAQFRVYILKVFFDVSFRKHRPLSIIFEGIIISVLISQWSLRGRDLRDRSNLLVIYLNTLL